jgi:diadenosine tetraphosphate (Ap4A) HIT family hydrolase
MPITSCDFCNELSQGKENAFARLYGTAPSSRMLFRSENFAVLPSLGQIVEGYLLIIPTKHYMAMADISLELQEELSRLCVRVRSALSQAYGPALFFEHGIRGTQAGGCGVDHAHLHAVPFDSAREPINELTKNHRLRTIDSISELTQRVSPNSPYLYYEQTNGQAWVCETECIPSQYVRKLLAESIGIESWDWRVSGRKQTLLSSISRLSGFFVGDSEDSPSQIASAVAAGVV